MVHRCEVFGCDNHHLYPEKQYIAPHVIEHMGPTKRVKFYGCKEQHYDLWTRLINRVNFAFQKGSVICSNHFEYGQPREQSPHPSKYMTGYIKCKEPKLRREITKHPLPPKRKRVKEVLVEIATNDQMQCDHDYDAPLDVESCARMCQFITPCEKCKDLVRHLRRKVAYLQKTLLELEQEKRKKTSIFRLDIAHLHHDDKLMKLYTGCPSYGVFYWLYEELLPKWDNLHYYKGTQTLKTPKWQISQSKKPGKQRELTPENELLLTLMKLRLNLLDKDLAFRFRISQSPVSSILSTILPFISKEMSEVIHWPDDPVSSYYPKCFEKFGSVKAIIDCTEVQTQRPSQTDVNSQLFSDYKQRHTYKVLVACTPGGSVSYISPSAGGDMSDVEILRRSGLLDKLKNGDVVLADKGFKDTSDFLIRGANLILPEFAKTDVAFTVEQNLHNTRVSNARIHVERVIGRLKEFRILRGDFPLHRHDLVDHVFNVVGIIVNLQGVLVPLK